MTQHYTLLDTKIAVSSIYNVLNYFVTYLVYGALC